MLKFFRASTVLLLLCWMLLIFSLSAQDAKSSSATSGGFVKTIIEILYPDFQNLSADEQLQINDTLQFAIRKTAHFTIYAILGILSFLSIITYKKLSFSLRIISASTFSLIYAISDELHQLSVSGRSGELRDVLIDFCGALLGIALLTLLTKLPRLSSINKYIH